jgi:hypothetical protein
MSSQCGKGALRRARSAAATRSVISAVQPQMYFLSRRVASTAKKPRTDGKSLPKLVWAYGSDAYGRDNHARMAIHADKQATVPARARSCTPKLRTRKL